MNFSLIRQLLISMLPKDRNIFPIGQYHRTIKVVLQLTEEPMI